MAAVVAPSEPTVPALLSLIVRHRAGCRHRRRIARQIVRAGRQCVDPPRAGPQTIRLELDTESARTSGRDHNIRVLGIGRLIALASDQE